MGEGLRVSRLEIPPSVPRRNIRGNIRAGSVSYRLVGKFISREALDRDSRKESGVSDTNRLKVMAAVDHTLDLSGLGFRV